MYFASWMPQLSREGDSPPTAVMSRTSASRRGPPSVRELHSSALPCDVPDDGLRALPYTVYPYHEPECSCAECSTVLRGQIFFCDYYSRHGYAPERGVHRYTSDFLVSWMKKCLSSWLPRSHWTGRAQEPAVYGRVEPIPGRSPEEKVWVYRLLIILPVRVSWNRLRDKILVNRRTGESVPLGELGGVRDWVDVHLWDGESTESLAVFYHRCREAIELGSAGTRQDHGYFGSEGEVTEQLLVVDRRLKGLI